MKKTILKSFLTFNCCLFFFVSAFGQKAADTNNLLPVVSDEVFKAIAQFYEYDADIPLDAKVIGKKEFSHGNREKIVFTGINNSRVPSYLILPKNDASTHPVVVIVDGINGNKERWFEDENWPKGGLVTKALLKNGFAVMVLDAVYHGERSAENDYAGPSVTYPIAARDMIMQTTIEYRRSMDYLASRTDIDINRIGVLGLSMGALITFQLTSVDSRIKTAVAGVTPYLKDPKYQPVAATTSASHILCDSFLMFVGNKDHWYTMEEARYLYDLIPATQKEFVEYDAGHEPPAKYVEKVSNWFVKYL